MIATLTVVGLLALTPAPSAQSPSAAARPAQAAAKTITGVVHDGSGLAVAGAVVVAREASGGEVQTVSGADGRFTVTPSNAGAVELVVRATGFTERRLSIGADAVRQDLEVVLSPASVSEMVTVTPTRAEERLGDVPASVNVLSHDDIQQSPAVVADDVLRQLPTFSLFLRTSSLSAHPTSQGVSLRGIGPSGVSRTLVLLDGVPFNDPFGGWVYWTRVPLESADRIEVVDNTSSSLYGNYAMGGVINILTKPAARRTFEIATQYGNLNSPKVDFSGSNVWGKLGVTFDGSAFGTDGFPIVAASERGRVDNKASVDFRNFNLKADYAASDKVHAFVRGGYFHENRDNGKASTIDGTEEANDTTWKSVSGGVRAELPDRSQLQASVFGDVETFHSNFLAVPTATPPRSLGRMSLNQTVPTKGFGGMVQWSRAIGGNQVFNAGTDWRWVRGESQEAALDTAKGQQVVTSRFSGGAQLSSGVYAEDVITPVPKLGVTLSARLDHWRNYDAHNLETTVATGLPTANNKPSLPDRTDTVVSPRLAARYHLTDRVSAWGDFGYGFRAPTLNELYRQFTKGVVLTKPNDQLGPERLKGGEFGVNLAPTSDLTIRSTWYDNRIKNPVSNVSQNKTSTILMRQNLGRTRIWGVQTDVEYHLGAAWRFTGAYLYNQAKVVEFNIDPALGLPSIVGNYLAQVPVHRGSVRVTYANPKYVTVALGVQFVGKQFDDDQNQAFIQGPALSEAGYDVPADPSTSPGLPTYKVVDLSASRDVGKNFEVYASAQNLFNRTFFVGTKPDTIGSPRLVSAGIRVRFAGK